MLDSVTVVLALREKVEVPVPQVEALAVGVEPLAPVAVGAPLKLWQLLALGVTVPQGVALALAVEVEALLAALVGVPREVAVAACQGVVVVLAVQVSVTRCDSEAEVVTVKKVAEGVTVPTEESEVRMEALGVEEKEELVLALALALPPAACSALGVMLAEDSTLMVVVSDTVLEVVTVTVTEKTLELLGSAERVEVGVASAVPLAVAETVSTPVMVMELDTLGEGLMLPEALPLPVALPVTLPVGVKQEVGVEVVVPVATPGREAVAGVLPVWLPAMLPEADCVAVALAVLVGPPAEGEAREGEAVAGKGVAEPEPLPPPPTPPGAVRVAAEVALVVEEPVREVALLAERAALGLRVKTAVGERVGVAESVCEAEVEAL